MSLLQPMTGLGPTSVVWAKDPQPMVNDTDRAIVTLNLRSAGANGVAEIRYSTDGLFTTELIDQRNIMLECLCEAYDYEIEASDILDGIRLGLRRAIGSLVAMNLALQTIKDTTELPTTYDDRVVNAAHMEINFGALRDVVPSDGGDSYIATVNGNNMVRGTLLGGRRLYLFGQCQTVTTCTGNPVIQ